MTSPSDTRDRLWDVVIVGAGMAGSFMAERLTRGGERSVLLVDAGEDTYFNEGVCDPLVDIHEGGGQREDHRERLLRRFYQAAYKTPNAPYPNLPWAQSPDQTILNDYYVERGPLPFGSSYTRIIGGTTLHWLGLVPRIHPHTFKEKTLYGRAADWPIDYDTLEPWYEDVEREMGVAGDDHRQGMVGVPPRRSPYPLPPLAPTWSDKQARAAWDGLTYTDAESGETFPVELSITPAARNSVPFDGRPACQGSANCIPICPTRAKYDASVHLKRALGLDHRDPHASTRTPAELMKKSVLVEVVLDRPENDQAEVKHLVLRVGPNADDIRTVRARRYVLAIHAMELPKVLLMSDRQRAGGVANGSDCVGRYLMDHDIAITWAPVDRPMYVFRGPRITSTVESLRDGAFRSYRAAFRPELSNVGTNWETGAPFSNVTSRVAQGLTGRALREAVAWDSQAVLHVDAMIEPDPQWNSRVRPSREKLDAWGIPRPEIEYHVGEYSERGRAVFQEVATQMYGRLGAAPSQVNLIPGWFGAGHVMGTTRMGADPKTSVTDDYGRTHEHPNLFLAGSGLFPTVGTVNPTLTLTALAVRTAALLEEELSR